MKKYIFILVCPKTKKVKHVGITGDPIKKYKFYKNDKRKSFIGDWFKSFKDYGYPKMKIVEEINSKYNKVLRVDYWKEFYKKKSLYLEKETRDRLVHCVLSQGEFNYIKKIIDRDFEGSISNFMRDRLLRGNMP
jgi:hypothetical protein